MAVNFMSTHSNCFSANKLLQRGIIRTFRTMADGKTKKQRRVESLTERLDYTRARIDELLNVFDALHTDRERLQ